MGTFGKGNSGSNYRVVEVFDAANSADHNQSNATYCYRLSGVVRVYVMEIITAKPAEPIEILGLSHITMVNLYPPNLKSLPSAVTEI